jgi:hypothetical protein
MKTTLISLSLGVGLAFTALGVSQADTPVQPPLPSIYSAPALYDLGNSYARMERPALAVLNYERARIFAPRDPDVAANLHTVRESTGSTAPGRGWLPEHARWANPNTMYWIGIFGLALAGTSLLLRGARSNHRAALGACAGLGGALVALAMFDACVTASVLRESVALFATPASASPISAAEPLFTVPLADVVKVQDRHDGFDLIIDSQGRKGWVASRDLEPVVPTEAAREVRAAVRAPAK